MESSFARLSIDQDDYLDEQGPPIWRSCPANAFEAWEAGGAGADQVHDKEPPFRCTTSQNWNFYDVHDGLLGDAPSTRLVVSLHPHRIEAGDEFLVCSLRQFTVSIALVDGDSGAPVQHSRTNLRATLVYADNGEPVPTQRGEAPLTGTLDGMVSSGGECHWRMRVTALSYHHSRRAFAVRIDADALPGSTSPTFACSHPIKAVARLPNEQPKAHVKGGTPATTATATALPADATIQQAATCRPSDTTIDQIASGPPAPTVPLAAAQPPNLARLRSPAVPTVENDDEEGEVVGYDEENDCYMMVEEDDIAIPADGSVASSLASGRPTNAYHTFTSHMDLLDELKVQGDMLNHMHAQQRFIIDELTSIRASRVPAY